MEIAEVAIDVDKKNLYIEQEYKFDKDGLYDRYYYHH